MDDVTVKYGVTSVPTFVFLKVSWLLFAFQEGINKADVKAISGNCVLRAGQHMQRSATSLAA